MLTLGHTSITGTAIAAPNFACHEEANEANRDDCDYMAWIIDDIAGNEDRERENYGFQCAGNYVDTSTAFAPLIVECFAAAYAFGASIDLGEGVNPESFRGLGPIIADVESCEQFWTDLYEITVTLAPDADINGRPIVTPERCALLVEMAAERGTVPSWSDHALKVASDAEAKAAELAAKNAEIAKEERATQEAEWARSFPDTYNSLKTLPELAEIARGIEVGRGTGREAGVVFAAGLVDYLLGSCPVNVSVADKASLIEFVGKAVFTARGEITGVDFDTAAAESYGGAQIMVEGAAAAQRLNCAEPATTKLVDNVLRILNGG